MKKKSLSSKPKLNTLGGIIFLAVSVSLTACQSTSTGPVIQRENSIFETTGIGESKIKAQENALTNAKQTCGRRQVIVIEDDLKYNGVLNESTGRVIDQMGSIAGIILGMGKPELSREDDYEYLIKFRCQ